MASPLPGLQVQHHRPRVESRWRRRLAALGLLVAGGAAMGPGVVAILSASVGATVLDLRHGALGGALTGLGVACLVASWWVLQEEQA